MTASSFPWSEQAVADLRKMRAEGSSASTIAGHLAAKFGHALTRSAVLGACYRLKIPLPPQQRESLLVRGGKISSARPAQARRWKEATAEPPIRLFKPEKIVAAKTPAGHPDDIATAPKGIMALTFNCCRWPLERTADDGSVLFCCNTRLEPSSFCEAHRARAVVKTRQRTQAEIDADAKRKASMLRTMNQRHKTYGFNRFDMRMVG